LNDIGQRLYSTAAAEFQLIHRILSSEIVPISFLLKLDFLSVENSSRNTLKETFLRQATMNNHPEDFLALRDDNLLKVAGYIEDETIVNEAVPKSLFIVPRTSSPILPKSGILKSDTVKKHPFEKRKLMVKRKSSTTELAITQGKPIQGGATHNLRPLTIKNSPGSKNDLVEGTEQVCVVRVGVNSEQEAGNKLNIVTNGKVENVNKISNVRSRLRHMLRMNGPKTGKENVPVVYETNATNMIYAERQPDTPGCPGEGRPHKRCQSDPAESKLPLPNTKLSKQSTRATRELNRKAVNAIKTKPQTINDSSDGTSNCVGRSQAPAAKLTALNRKLKPVLSTVVAPGVRVHVLSRTRQLSASSIIQLDVPVARGGCTDIEYIPMFELHKDKQSEYSNQCVVASKKQEPNHYQRLQLHRRADSTCSRIEANANVERWLTDTSVAARNEHVHLNRLHDSQIFSRGGRGVSCRTSSRVVPPENLIPRKSRRSHLSDCESTESDARMLTPGVKNCEQGLPECDAHIGRRRSHHHSPAGRPTPVGNSPLIDNCRNSIQDLDKYWQSKLNASLLQFVTEVIESLEAAKATNESSDWSSHAFRRSFDTPLAEGRREAQGSRPTTIRKIPKILLNNCNRCAFDDPTSANNGEEGEEAFLFASQQQNRLTTGRDDVNMDGKSGDGISKLDSGVSGSVDSVQTALDNLHTNLVEVFERADNNIVGLGGAALRRAGSHNE